MFLEEFFSLFVFFVFEEEEEIVVSKQIYILEQVLCWVEDEEDICVVIQVKVEQVVEFVEFNENDGFFVGEGEEVGWFGVEDEEMFWVEQEIVVFVEQLIFIECYVMKFLEVLLEEVS